MSTNAGSPEPTNREPLPTRGEPAHPLTWRVPVIIRANTAEQAEARLLARLGRINGHVISMGQAKEEL